MASSPTFVGSGFANPCALIDAISTKRDGSGTYDTIVSGGPSLVRAVRFQAITLTADTSLLIFYNDGTNKYLIGDIPMRTVTPTGIDPGWSYLWTPPHPEFFIPSGDSLMAAMYSGAAALHAWAIGGNT
jgi:hypothetical protein